MVGVPMLKSESFSCSFQKRQRAQIRKSDVIKYSRLYDALDEFSKPSLLIIDDFFTTPVENPANAVDLFEILEAREGRGSTLIATQLEPDQWYLRIDSDLRADSILNRVVEHARFLDIKGPNMREYTARLKAEREKGYWD